MIMSITIEFRGAEATHLGSGTFLCSIIVSAGTTTKIMLVTSFNIIPATVREWKLGPPVVYLESFSVSTPLESRSWVIWVVIHCLCSLSVFVWLVPKIFNKDMAIELIMIIRLEL